MDDPNIDWAEQRVIDETENDRAEEHFFTSTPKTAVVAATTQGPHAFLQLENSKIPFLFDTGSNESIISADILTNADIVYQLRPIHIKLEGIAGGGLNILGVAELPCTIHNVQKYVDFLVVQEADIAIFGLNNMRSFNLLIDIAKGTFWSNGQETTYALSKGSGSLNQSPVFYIATKSECNIKLINDEIILARGHKIVFGEIFKNIPKTEFCLLELDYAQQRYGSLMPACVTNTDTVVPFSIMNNFDRPVRFRKGALMGVASDTELQTNEDVIDLLSDADTDGSPDGHPIDKMPKLDYLEKDKREEVENLCKKYHTCFSRGETDIGKCALGPQRLPLKEDYKVVRDPPRRYNVEQMRAIDAHVDIMRRAGTIEPSSSEWRCWPVLTSKRGVAGSGAKTGSDANTGNGAAVAKDAIPPRYSRFCLDMRNQNKMWKDGDTYSRALPRMQDVFDGIASAIEGATDPYFAKLDVSSAFHCIEIHPDDRAPTAFYASRGLWQFRRFSFGIKSAGSIFVDCLERSLTGLSFSCCFAYLDDLVVVGKTWREFIGNLEAVLLRLSFMGFKLKPKKLELAKKKVEMLGFLISAEGIQIGLDKMRAAQLWSRPVSQSETLSFVQFCNFLRKHIEAFALVARPLYDLCNSDKFEWTDECEQSFQRLKQAVVSAPALRLPDFSKQMWVACDWCKVSCGWALLQRENDTTGNWYVIVFGSKTATRKKGTDVCSSNKGELWAMQTALISLKCYLISCRKFTVLTDHKALSYLTKQRDVSAHVVRMLEKVSELGDFEIQFLSSKDPRIGIVDRLSRARLDKTDSTKWSEIYTSRIVAAVTRSATQKMNEETQSSDENTAKKAGISESLDPLEENENPTNIADGPNDGPTNQSEASKEPTNPSEGSKRDPNNQSEASNDLTQIDWEHEQNADSDISTLKGWIESGEKQNDKVKLASNTLRTFYVNFVLFTLISGIVYRVWTVTTEQTRNLIVVPAKRVRDVLYAMHDVSTHIGQTRTLLNIRQYYYWPGMSKDVEVYVKSCDICQRRNKTNKKAPLQPIAKSYFNEFLFMDIKTLHNYPAGQYTSVLVMVEGFSKYVSLAPLITHTTTEIMSKVWKEYLSVWGVPAFLVTDREPSFILAVSHQFYDLLGIKKLNTVSHKPLADGQSESYVKIVSKVMTTLFATERLDGQTDHDWAARLPYVKMAINSVPSTTTGFSPHYIATGRELILPSNLTLSLPKERMTVPQSVRSLWETAQQTYDAVLKNSGQQMAKAKTRYDAQNVIAHEEYHEGDLVLYRQYSSNLRDPKSFSSAFETQVYVITKKLGSNYFIRPTNKPDTPKNTKCVHFNQIRAYIQRDNGTDRDAVRRAAGRPARLGFNLTNLPNDETIH